MTVSQRTDGTFVVDVYYDVYDADGDLLTISLEVSDDGGTTWDVDCQLVSGDIGNVISPGNGKHIVWDIGSEHPNIIEAYKFKVVADDGVITDITSGLILHYPFEGNALDVSGNGNNGVAQGNYTYMDGAISLTGRGDVGSGGGHVIIPLLDFNNMANFTINIWVNEHAMTYSHGEGYIFYGYDPRPNHQISIGHWGSGVAGNISYRVGNAPELSIPFVASYLDNWVMHTIVFQNGTVRAYINSDLIGTSQGSINITSNNAGLARHWFPGGTTSTRFTGRLDDVRVYNRALTEVEIQHLFNSGR